MFWVGLATLIMIISGSGDDSRDLRERWERMRDAIVQEVPDAPRAKEALGAVKAVEDVLWSHRARLEVIAKCLEKADRSYDAKASDYFACEKMNAQGGTQTTNELIKAELRIRAALKEQEFRIILKRANGADQ